LESARPYVAYISSEDDPDDFYYLTISTLDEVHAELTVPISMDLDLWVYDAELNTVAGSNLTGLGIDESIEFTPSTTGTYYLRVYPFKGWSKTEPYTLVATFDEP
jgi:hypothetical protein